MSHEQIPPAPVYYSSRRPEVSAGAGLDPLVALEFEAAVSQLCAVLPFEDESDDQLPDADEEVVERLALLEERLAQVEAAVVASGHIAPADLPNPASIADSLGRIADALAPAPTDIVGSPYVAQRLGCTTVWVAEMVRLGQIPKHCLVSGTGHGRPWKFFKREIDRWIASR